PPPPSPSASPASAPGWESPAEPGAFRRSGRAAGVVVVTVRAYGSSSALAAHPARRKSLAAPGLVRSPPASRLFLFGLNELGRERGAFAEEVLLELGHPDPLPGLGHQVEPVLVDE